MRYAAQTGVLFITIATLLAVGSCSQTTSPEGEVLNTPPTPTRIDVDPAPVEDPPGIKRLSIATVKFNMLSETKDQGTIAAVLAELTDEQRRRVIARSRVRVVEPDVVLTILGLFGINPPDATVLEDGVFTAVYTRTTWGKIKCCYKDPNCCPKPPKKDQ
jgi:hypothetical protein